MTQVFVCPADLLFSAGLIEVKYLPEVDELNEMTKSMEKLPGSFWERLYSIVYPGMWFDPEDIVFRLADSLESLVNVLGYISANVPKSVVMSIPYTTDEENNSQKLDYYLLLRLVDGGLWEFGLLSKDDRPEDYRYTPDRLWQVSHNVGYTGLYLIIFIPPTNPLLVGDC